jgi:hypothetical protein
MSTKISKKLSTKSVVGNVKEIRKIAESGEGKHVDIMRVMGVAKKLQVGESDNGEWLAFKGNFEYINLITGESHVGSRCFLPAPIDSMVEAQLEGNTAVEFAFDITVVEVEESATGYEYGAKTILKPSENDPMEMLKQTVSKESPLQIANNGDTKEKAPSKKA